MKTHQPEKTPISSLKESIQKLIAGFRLAETAAKEKTGKASCPISLWLPPTYKADYDDLQKRSGNEFGKLLQELCKNAIDLVK